MHAPTWGQAECLQSSQTSLNNLAGFAGCRGKTFHIKMTRVR